MQQRNRARDHRRPGAHWGQERSCAGARRANGLTHRSEEGLWAALRAADVYQAISPRARPTRLITSLWPTASRSPDAKVMRRSEAARRWSGQTPAVRALAANLASDVDDLGKRDVLGPFGCTRRDPWILELRSALTLNTAYCAGLC